MVVECLFERVAFLVDRIERGELRTHQLGVLLAASVRLVDEAAEVAERELATAAQVRKPPAQRRPLEKARSTHAIAIRLRPGHEDNARS